ncbi:MAG: VanZ family protein [Saprospiraceae bacterium]|nr:VanZ family protein [Saprospiraceae bacterium]
MYKKQYEFLNTKNIIALFYIGFIAILLFASDVGYLNKSRGWLAENVFYYDKVGHFVLIGFLAFILNLLFLRRNAKYFNPKLLIGSYLTFAFSTIEEFSQIFIESRSFNVYDLMANYLGIAFFSLLFFLVFKKFASKKENQNSIYLSSLMVKKRN